MPSERTLLSQVLARQEATVRRAFQGFLADTRSPESMRTVRNLIESGRIEPALEFVDQHVVRFANVIPRMFTNAANEQLEDLGSRFGRELTGGQTIVGFDPTNERAAEVMRTSRLQFIRDFTREQRATTREALSDTLREGGHPRTATEKFRDSIGLTRPQLRAVDNYRRLLERQSPEALNRQLRDRRFDRSVENAAESGEPLSSDQIDRMVDRYQARQLAHRAETIARTEALRATSQARQEALDQMMEQTGLEPSDIVQVWNATQDGRTRDTHFAMDGQEQPLGKPFRSPSGALLRYPGDPKAPAAETINCFIPGQEVSGAFTGGLKAYYSGPIREIETVRGNRLRVTPNHPILTTKGWVAADKITEGYTLFNYAGQIEGSGVSTVNREHCPTTIEQVFQTFRSDGVTFVTTRDGDLHGDVEFCNSQIEIVAAKIVLKADCVPCLRQRLSYLWDKFANSVIVRSHAFSPLGLSFDRVFCTTSSSPSFVQQFLSFLLPVRATFDLAPSFAHLSRGTGSMSDISRLNLLINSILTEEFEPLPPKFFGVGLTADDGFTLLQQSQYSRAAYTNLASKLQDGRPRNVALDNVVRVREFNFSGHVYDLQTVSGWYLVEHTIVSNCRCVLSTVIL